MKLYKSYIILLIFAVSGFLLTGCPILSSPEKPAIVRITTGTSKEDMQRNILSRGVALVPLETFRVTIKVNGEVTQTLQFTTETIQFEVQPGSGISFKLETLDTFNKVAYTGESAPRTISAGETVNLTIPLQFADGWTVTLAVRSGAAPGGDGSENSPYNTITAALSKAATFTTQPVEIRVATGTYDDALTISSNNVYLSGGWDSGFTSRTYFTIQDRATNLTKITNSTSGSTIAISGNNVTIEGFTIEASASFSNTIAIGRSSTANQNVYIRNNTIINNSSDSGKGISIGDTTTIGYANYVEVINNLIDAGENSGGIDVQSGSDMYIGNNIIKNTASSHPAVNLNNENNNSIYLLNNTIVAVSYNAVNVIKDFSALVISNNLISAAGSGVYINLGATSQNSRILQNNYIYTIYSDNTNYDYGASGTNIFVDSNSDPAINPEFDSYYQATNDPRIKTGAQDLGSYIDSLSISGISKNLLKWDITGAARSGSAWGIGAYTHSAIDRLLLFVNVDGNPEGDGSKSAPYQTIAAALLNASYFTNQPVEIRVATGTYDDALTISSNNVYLSGGWDSGFTSRTYFTIQDRATNLTKITNSTSGSTIAISGNNVTIEGFTIEASASATNSIAVGRSSTANQNVYIRNNTIINNSSVSGKGISIGDTTTIGYANYVEVINNLIDAGENSGGIDVQSGSDMYIGNNIIKNTASSHPAVNLNNVDNNSIYLLNNTIVADSGNAVNVKNDFSDSALVIRNNLISAAGSGVYILATSPNSSILQYNYIYTIYPDNTNYDYGASGTNIYSGSTPAASDPVLEAASYYQAKNNDSRIVTGGQDLSSYIDGLSISTNTKDLLKKDITDKNRGTGSWSIGAYNSLGN